MSGGWTDEYWDDSAADWETWAEVVAPQAKGFNVPLVKAAGIEPGGAVLDLACGLGEPALTALGAVGPDGRVVATDIAPNMVAAAQRRAESKGLTNIEFQVADMAHLPFDANSFDYVISRFGIMYADDPAAVFREAGRVLKSSGTAAFMVWGARENNTVLTVAIDAANDRLKVFEDDEAGHPFVFSEADSLASIMREGGFQAVEEMDLAFDPEIPASLPFWQPIVGMNCGAAMRQLGKAETAEIDAAVKDAYAPYLAGESYKLKAHVRIGLGKAP